MHNGCQRDSSASLRMYPINTKPQPTEIRKASPLKLVVTWNDGLIQEIPSALLRQSCPCAVCVNAREKAAAGAAAGNPPVAFRKSALRIVDHSIEEQTQLVDIWPIGNYALGVQWKDGHSGGIYDFQYLRLLNPAPPKMS